MTDDTIKPGRQALLSLLPIGIAGALIAQTSMAVVDKTHGLFNINYETTAPTTDTQIKSLVSLAEATPVVEFTVKSTEAFDKSIGDQVEKYDPNQKITQASPVGFEVRSERIETERVAMLDKLEEQAIVQADNSRRTLIKAGLPLESLTSFKAKNIAAPTNFVVNADYSSDQEEQSRMVQVASRIEETKRLTDILMAAPLSIPIEREVRISSGFGMRMHPIYGESKFHKGIDMAAPMGTKIHSAAPGKITFAGWKEGYGNTVEITHGNGFMTRYGHMSSIDVELGQSVRTDDVVGRVGQTGAATGPHLHYEVWYNGNIFDPRNFMIAGKDIYRRNS